MLFLEHQNNTKCPALYFYAKNVTRHKVLKHIMCCKSRFGNLLVLVL